MMDDETSLLIGANIGEATDDLIVRATGLGMATLITSADRLFRISYIDVEYDDVFLDGQPILRLWPVQLHHSIDNLSYHVTATRRYQILGGPTLHAERMDW